MGTAKRLLPLLGVIIWIGTTPLWAQEDETPAQKAYREDYEQYQKITAIKDPMKRADALLQFMGERPKTQIEANVRHDFLQIVQQSYSQSKWDTVVAQTERYVKVRPRVGEAYYFLGSSYKELGKLPEAMDALAKCSVIKSPISEKARTFLESIYKGTHQGKTAGLEDLIAKARREVGD